LPSNSGIQRGISWTGAWSTSISRGEWSRDDDGCSRTKQF
jgi:hypothetical protein